MRSVDFERVLATPIRARSPHFAVHFLDSCPSAPAKPRKLKQSTELSTGSAPDLALVVDESRPESRWLGTVVPKRHARRAVTRNLLKRQIRHLAQSQSGLAHGLWVVRLRSPFDRAQFGSAASDNLRVVARQELEAVLADAARRVIPASA